MLLWRRFGESGRGRGQKEEERRGRRIVFRWRSQAAVQTVILLLSRRPVSSSASQLLYYAADRSETSRKPDEVYGVIERLAPHGRKLELFGRKHNIRPGWLTLGNQREYTSNVSGVTDTSARLADHRARSPRTPVRAVSRPDVPACTVMLYAYGCGMSVLGIVRMASRWRKCCTQGI